MLDYEGWGMQRAGRFCQIMGVLENDTISTTVSEG